MSFYSALRLCANTGVDRKKCTAKALHALLEELDLLDPEASDEFGNMHPRLYDLFDDAIAGKENTRLFRPDTIGLETKIGIYSLRDQGWESDGYSISISGYGYFFPLELKDYRNLIEESSLSTLAERVDALFGGKFKFPFRRRTYLRQRCILERDGWCWFGSET